MQRQPRRLSRRRSTVMRGALALLLTVAGLAGVAAPPASVAAGEDEWRTIARLAELDPAALRDTTYPVPSGAYFVAPGGDDANPGTRDAPWATLVGAVGAAPAGATIVFRAGTYRSGTVVITKPLTLQPFPRERAWIKGSVEVTGWVPDGNAWRKDGWTPEFPPLSSLPGGGAGCPANNPRCALDPAYPLADYRDMVFIDGRPLRQVATRAEVAPATATAPATFYVDLAADQLVIGADPTGKLVEATAHLNGVEVGANNAPVEAAAGTAIRGLGFAHYGDTALRLRAARPTLEASTITWNGVQGAVVNNGAADVAIRDNTFSYNGRKGLSVFGPPRALVEGNLVSTNNVERFRQAWDAAGMKLVPVKDAVVRANLAQDNLANAIWLDNSATNVTIVYNLARRNEGIGIFFEVSRGAIIASNVALENGRGIRVSGSSAVKVYNNTLVRNVVNLNVYDSSRINPNATEVAAGIDYETRDVTVKNNIFSDTFPPGASGLKPALLDVTHDPCNTSPKPPCNDTETMLAALDHNLYHRSQATQPPTAVQWRPVPVEPVGYPTLEAFRAATGYERNGLALDNVPSTALFKQPADGDYRVQGNSPAHQAGESLPDDVAAALGVKPGKKIEIGALDPKLKGLGD